MKFKANPTSVLHLSVQIKKLDLSINKIGNSGAKALATCLWNIDELDELYLMGCDITECEELCNAIQSLKRPVSFNLVSRHTVLEFVQYASVKICRGYWENVEVTVKNISWFCLKSNELNLTTAWKYSFIKQKQPTVERMCAVGYDLVFRNEKNFSAGKNSWTTIFAEFGKVFNWQFFTDTHVKFVHALARALRKIHFCKAGINYYCTVCISSCLSYSSNARTVFSFKV